MADETGLGEGYVRELARHVAGYKGWPWSETEFNAENLETRRSLEEERATKEQLALYDEIVKGAPLRGGRFNNWSGD